MKDLLLLFGIVAAASLVIHAAVQFCLWCGDRKSAAKYALPGDANFSEWHFYPEPFNPADRPPPPQNQSIRRGLFSGWEVTPESKREGAEWNARLDQWSRDREQK